MPAFLDSFRFYRLDEVLGPEALLRRGGKRHPTCLSRSWRGVPRQRCAGALCSRADLAAASACGETLEKIAPHIPLVILSNSMVDLIPHSVAHLKAPFHAVYTAEQAQAYKPRGQAFEYMFDQLGCGPEEMVHCSSSFRYDLMTAKDLGFMGKASSIAITSPTAMVMA
jgi:2-haloacid dehalogenase